MRRNLKNISNSWKTKLTCQTTSLSKGKETKNSFIPMLSMTLKSIKTSFKTHSTLITVLVPILGHNAIQSLYIWQVKDILTQKFQIILHSIRQVVAPSIYKMLNKSPKIVNNSVKILNSRMKILNSRLRIQNFSLKKPQKLLLSKTRC